MTPAAEIFPQEKHAIEDPKQDQPATEGNLSAVLHRATNSSGDFQTFPCETIKESRRHEKRNYNHETGDGHQQTCEQGYLRVRQPAQDLKGPATRRRHSRISPGADR